MKTKTKTMKSSLLFKVKAMGMSILTLASSAAVYAACSNQYASNRLDQPSGCTLSEEGEETESTPGGGGCIYYFDPSGNTFCRTTEDQTDCVDDTYVLPNDGHTVYLGFVRTYCVDGECVWDTIAISSNDTVEAYDVKYKTTIDCPAG